MNAPAFISLLQEMHAIHITNSVGQESPTPGPQTSTSPWPVKNLALREAHLSSASCAPTPHPPAEILVPGAKKGWGPLL